MQHNTSYIINRLKHQSRHGTNIPGTNLPNLDDLAKSAQDALKSLESLPVIISKISTSLLQMLDGVGMAKTGLGQFARGLDKVIQQNEYTAKSINDLYKSMSILEIRNAAINKSFGISSLATAKLADTYQKLSTNLKITNDQTNQYASSIHKLLPTFNQLGKENDETYLGLIATQQVLQTQLGLSEELANSYSLYATQTGKNAVAQLQITDAIAKSLDPEGTIGDYHSIISDIANLTGDIQLQFGRIPGKLELAVLRSKQLGLNFEQVSKAGDNLLNIESSVGQELNYQLLTGRRLVDQDGRSLTEKMRTAKLTGDAVGMQAAMQQILERESGTLETNLMARREMAELLQTDEGTLARTLQKMRLLKDAAGKGIDLSLSKSDDERIKKLADANYTSDQIATMLQDTTNDTRTSNQIMEQQLQTLQDMKIIAMVQATDDKSNYNIILALQKEMKKDAIERGKKNAFAELTTKEATQAGVIMLSMDAAKPIVGLKNEVISPGGSAGIQTAPAAETTLKDGLIMPAGLGGVISMPEGTIGFQENDGIAVSTNIKSNSAAQSSGNTDTTSNAIDRQTAILVKALEQLGRQQSAFGPGLNSSYFS
ncbi:hypothetical protein UFOVP1307_209 [uncultured Caudovirales phage]|uniref:Uncharacterized protein n=1 Tax=uncultured Caudovirales phage TaxID=2100421 RepID=A0A6J5RYQ3_9CAUD|nr:hypothetical protein UFOVP651_137 [uncultured Caudovirales phage]CAB4171155.1 hypothetical protein UFOVP902_216 [uncultured Caudovirales phage]CAB4198678.1 hypothetical protein UFOVP1307_209 [uncultured Caudovirales phage]